jgi:hypothetical protein
VNNDFRLKFVALQALERIPAGYRDKMRGHKPASSGRNVTNDFGLYKDLLFQTVLCREVDNYLTYLTDLLTLVFKARPETLKSRETVTIEEALSHDTIDDLVHSLAEKRVPNLSYLGLLDLSKYFSERLGLSIFDDASDAIEANALVAARNLLVHNRGIVDKTFLETVPDCPLTLGDMLEPSSQEVLAAQVLFPRLTSELERKAAKKFGIPQTSSWADVTRRYLNLERGSNLNHEVLDKDDS